MNKFCKVCGTQIPQQRLEILPNTKYCVNHSSTDGYKAITTTNGEGDHTWNDIQLVSGEDYSKLIKQ